MSFKVHFLQNHLEYFPENLGALNEGQGERFHQDIKIMEKRKQGKYNVHMIADYCWCLIRVEENFKSSRKSKKQNMFLNGETNFACSVKSLDTLTMCC